jgi:protein arginine kinase
MSEIDSSIANTVKFAYDEQLGYLTACPTNLGTGLRASVMMFLPALTINEAMPRLMRYLSRKGLTVRGMFGEGSEAEGYHYQISNEVTLGSSEETILALVQEVVEKIVELEGVERSRLVTGADALTLKDKCLRAYGVLTNCALLTAEECISLASYVKLGVCLGFLQATSVEEIDTFVERMHAKSPYMVEPNAEAYAAFKEQSEAETNRYRAEYAKATISKIVFRK